MEVYYTDMGLPSMAPLRLRISFRAEHPRPASHATVSYPIPCRVNRDGRTIQSLLRGKGIDMIDIEIPGLQKLEIEHVVFDYNGTLAVDGRKLPCVDEGIRLLADRVEVHVVTADTFGLAGQELEGLPCRLTVLPQDGQHRAKRDFVRDLGAGRTVAVGNGSNDRLMLREARLGICLILEEGASTEALARADVVCRSLEDALGLFHNPKRLIATLRS